MKWFKVDGFYLGGNGELLAKDGEEWFAKLHHAVLLRPARIGYALILYRKGKNPALCAAWMGSTRPCRINLKLEDEFLQFNEIVEDAQREVNALCKETPRLGVI